MTKLQIISSKENPIAGFDCIKLETEGFFSSNLLEQSLNTYSDNECELILCVSIIDHCSNDKLQQTISSLITKLRLGGKIVIGGTDLTLFCKSVINDLFPENAASSIISTCKGMYNMSTIENLLSSLGLQIEYSKLNGVAYEISAIRK